MGKPNPEFFTRLLLPLEDLGSDHVEVERLLFPIQIVFPGILV